MKKTILGRFGVLFFALFFLISGVPIYTGAAAASWVDITETVPEGVTVIETQNGYNNVELWHYSGGYWARNASDPLRITDSQIKDSIENLADIINETLKFEYALPEAVNAALKAGKKVGVCVAAPAGNSYFNTSRGLPQVKIDNGKLQLQAYPRFNFMSASDYTYRYFVSGLNAFIPFVNPKYGHNVYAMYSNSGVLLGTAHGYFNSNDPLELGKAGTIHPSQIANSGGALKGGFQVSIGGKLYDSSAVKIGVGTFQNAGAVGFIFEYGLTITYYEIEDMDVAVTAVTPVEFPPKKLVSVYVKVENLGTSEATTPVTFDIPGIVNTRSDDITLAPGESKVITFTFTTPENGTFPMTAEVNPERIFDESNYKNNILTVTGKVQADNDVAVTKIEKTSYPATSVVTADVTVKNLGLTPITTPVEFSIPGITTQSADVTLAAGQSLVLHFTFSTPPTGTLTMTAEANKSRSFTESDYTNNKLTVTAQIIPLPTGSTSCSDTITWMETDYHMVYYYIGFFQYSYPCYHTFTYETKLTTNHGIAPKTFKSGYGFAVTIDNAISTRLVSNQGCGAWGAGRANTLIPTPPDKAQVKLGWTTKNRLGTQPSVVDLLLTHRNAIQSQFECKPNPISEIKAKLIYTDVALAGTGQNPKQHQILLSVTGGGVNGIPFCKEITDKITINGNMYEDDATGAN